MVALPVAVCLSPGRAIARNPTFLVILIVIRCPRQDYDCDPVKARREAGSSPPATFITIFRDALRLSLLLDVRKPVWARGRRSADMHNKRLENCDDASGMGIVVWIFIACILLGIVLFIVIPW
jgi:hypothetical protein